MLPVRFAAACLAVVALVSVWHSFGHIWRRIGDDRRVYSAVTPRDRLHGPAAAVQLSGELFDWYAQFVAKGDRFYVQVDPHYEPRVVKMLAGYYLLPAAEVETPAQATVVVSYYANPGALGIHFLTQQEAGLQPFFVSRIKAP